MGATRKSVIAATLTADRSKFTADLAAAQQQVKAFSAGVAASMKRDESAKGFAREIELLKLEKQLQEAMLLNDLKAVHLLEEQIMLKRQGADLTRQTGLDEDTVNDHLREKLRLERDIAQAQSQQDGGAPGMRGGGRTGAAASRAGGRVRGNSSGANGAGMVAIQGASLIDDMQYGLRGVMNNVIGIGMLLPGWGQALAGVAAITGIVALQWDTLTGKAAKIKAELDDAKRFAERAERAATEAVTAAVKAAEREAFAVSGQVEHVRALVEYARQRQSHSHALLQIEKEIAAATLNAGSKTKEEKIRGSAEMEKSIRERTANEVFQVEQENLKKTEQQQASLLDRHIEEAAKLKALEDQAARQRTENGQADMRLQRELEAQRVRAATAQQESEEATAAVVEARQAVANARHVRDEVNPKQAALDQLQTEAEIKKLREEGARNSAELVQEGVERAVKMTAQLLENVKQASAERRAGAKTREGVREDAAIAAERAKGNTRKADRMEADQTEKKRAEELRKMGFGREDAAGMAKTEREQKEDADNLQKTGRRRIRSKSRSKGATGLDGTTFDGLDNDPDNQTMSKLFEQKMNREGAFDQKKRGGAAAAKSTPETPKEGMESFTAGMKEALGPVIEVLKQMLPSAGERAAPSKSS